MTFAHSSFRQLRATIASSGISARGAGLSAVFALSFLSPFPAAGQSDPARPPMLATSVSDDEEAGWEDPELWGATFVAAVPEDTPLLVEYETVAGHVRQSLQIFHGGYVRCDWTEGEQTSSRLIRLPEDAAAHWKTLVKPLAQRVAGYRPLTGLSAGDSSRIVVHTEEGPRTYPFSTAAALPSDLGTFRELLDALARAVTGDRQISNPLALYEPRVGDVLLGEDGVSYRITRYLPERRIVELRRTEPPMTTWVAVRDLYTMFTTIVPGGRPLR